MHVAEYLINLNVATLQSNGESLMDLERICPDSAYHQGIGVRVDVVCDFSEFQFELVAK